MKNKLRLYIAVLAIVLIGCSAPADDKLFNIRMQKISGDWVSATYNLPEDSYFFISSHRGSYYLKYDERSRDYWGKAQSGKTIRAGIIDYEVTN